MRDATRDHPVVDGHGSSSDYEDPQEKQESSTATGRQMRHIRLPQRYDYVDLVAYLLTMPEETWAQEPSSYSKTVTSNESAQRVVAMNLDIESLHKNQT